VRRGSWYRPSSPASALALLLLLVFGALAGCGVTDTQPVKSGAPARAKDAVQGTDLLRVYFLTSHGSWPVTRRGSPGAGPQTALDALLAGPTRSERARGLVTALPAGAHRVRAQASSGAIDLYLPWLVSELDRVAVNQLVCTAAAAPGIPEAGERADVVVRIHESGLPESAWHATCDESGAAVPLGSGGPDR
jgi:hypothetical protein